MKLKLLLLLWLTPSLMTAQPLSENAEKIMVPDAAVKTIVIDQPADSVYAFLSRYPYLNLNAAEPMRATIEALVTDLQTFTDKVTFDAYKKEGKEFYNVYSFSIPARWKLLLKPKGERQTAVSFQLLAYYLDSQDPNYQYAKTYKTQQQIVSNNNLEGLIELYARQHFAAAPIAAVTFSREKGFDNTSYRYNDFIPGNAFKEKGVWNSTVPYAGIQKPVGSHLVVYAKAGSSLLSVNEQSLAIDWRQDVPFLPGQQNHNDFTVYHNAIYLPSNNGSITAVDAVTGNVYWQCSPLDYKTPKLPVFFGQQAPVSDSMVYVNDDKRIYAINRFSGKVAWSQRHGGYGHYNYGVDDSYIYKSGILETFQIRKKDGEVHKIINSTRANTFYYPNLLLPNQQIILCDGDTYCYDLQQDKILWHNDLAYKHIAGSKDGKRIYLDLSDDKRLVSLDAATGKEVWQYKMPVSEGQGAAVLDFKLYKGQLCMLVSVKTYNETAKDAYSIMVIDAASGKMVHNKALTGKAYSNLVIDDQHIMLVTANGFTYLNKTSGRISEKQYDVKAWAPANDYELNYVERIQ